MKISYKQHIYESVDTEKTPSFLSWFGDSKVVDKEGKPLNVYHGTANDFEVFDINRSYKSGAVGSGFYFTTSPHEASSYIDLHASSGNRDENHNIMPVYLKMSNPFYIGVGESETLVEVPAMLRTAMMYMFKEIKIPENPPKLKTAVSNAIYEIMELVYGNLGRKYTFRDFQETFFSENVSLFINSMRSVNILDKNVTLQNLFRDVILTSHYDGVIMDGSVFDLDGSQGTVHYIVYKPNQIKSVFNKNPTDHVNITKE